MELFLHLEPLLLLISEIGYHPYEPVSRPCPIDLQTGWQGIDWIGPIHKSPLPYGRPVTHFAHWLLSDRIGKSSPASSPCTCCPSTSRGSQLFVTSLSFKRCWLLESPCRLPRLVKRLFRVERFTGRICELGRCHFHYLSR